MSNLSAYFRNACLAVVAVTSSALYSTANDIYAPLLDHVGHAPQESHTHSLPACFWKTCHGNGIQSALCIDGSAIQLSAMLRTCHAGMLPTNVMHGHLETTDHTITLVDKVRDMVRDMVTRTSTKAVETAATKAERGKAAAVLETHRTGETAVIYLTYDFFRSQNVPNAEHGHIIMLTAGASGLTMLFWTHAHLWVSHQQHSHQHGVVAT